MSKKRVHYGASQGSKMRASCLTAKVALWSTALSIKGAALCEQASRARCRGDPGPLPEGQGVEAPELLARVGLWTRSLRGFTE